MKKAPAIILLSIILTASVPSSAGDAANAKTLGREEDPVVIKCERLPGLEGASPERLSLMSFQNGRWMPVPFQVDQVKPDGSYALTSGKMAGPDPDPMLDANDELAFMARDSGDRRPPEAGPPEGAVSGVEIEIIDPLDGGKGYAYLVRFDSDPPRSERDYIQLVFDEESGRRWTESDKIMVGSPMNRVYPDYISNRGLPSGGEGKDVLDRLKVRGTLVFPFGIEIPIAMEEFIYARPLGHIDGPVRVIEHVDGYLKLAGIEFKGIGDSFLCYYDDSLSVPVTIAAASKVPDWLLEFIPKSRLRGYMDFNENVYGSHVFSAANPWQEGVVLDGEMSDAEKNLDLETEVDWLAGRGPEGGLVFRLLLEEQSGDLSKMTTYYVDDKNGEDPPEDEAGVSAVGFDITGTTGSVAPEMVKRSASFTLMAYAKNDLTEENIHAVLDILDHPLRTETRAAGF